MKIVEINPAYTSQRYSSCGYKDKSNRKKRHTGYGLCGERVKSQVNKAKNIHLPIKRHIEGLNGYNGVLVGILI
ncbi:MAG TPA: transposase [Geminocystis sp. M7585_C2015_104]|nr:transposase [Geminocystis sp. M7585_C2015_104]